MEYGGIERYLLFPALSKQTLTDRKLSAPLREIMNGFQFRVFSVFRGSKPFSSAVVISFY
jgi:hypothetical protein